MELTISPKRIARILGLVVLFYTLATLTARTAWFGWGSKEFLGLSPLLDAAEETSIPTWYQSLALLLCSILLATIATAEKREGTRYALHWGTLSAIFLLLSMDEVAMIHEYVGSEVGKYVIGSMGFTKTGFLYFSWVVPAIIFVLVVLLAFLRFLYHLPKKTLFLFLVAGTLFVAGAIGMEMLEGLLQTTGDYTYGGVRWRRVQQTFEEALEMMGVVVFIYALLWHISSRLKEVTIRFGTKDE